MKSLLFFVGLNSFAQTNNDKGCKPPKNHELWHDRIDREQRGALKTFKEGNNEEINYYVTQALSKKIDELQCRIEKDSTIKDQQKVGYLKGVEYLVKNFTSLYKNRQFNASNFPAALDVYEESIAKDKTGQTIQPLIDESSYEVGRLVLASDAFTRNAGYKISQNNLFFKFCILHPEQIFPKLKDNPDVQYRDSLIRIAAYKYPKKLYDFAVQIIDWVLLLEI